MKKELFIEKFIPPTIHDMFGNKLWKNQYGDIHREGDKAAIIMANGDKFWYNHDKIHRDRDKPAIVRSTNNLVLNNTVGTNPQFEYFKNGIRHRDNDKPAMIFFDGTKIWVENGLVQRSSGGPAHVTSFYKAWYIEGVKIKTEYNYGSKFKNFVMNKYKTFSTIVILSSILISYILYQIF